ncbi:MAG TPA: hypothetical protein VNS60_05565 [Solirubrobacterales bacterium]|nr:hypothetical protein [Solirubrobacterales bacterium]
MGEIPFGTVTVGFVFSPPEVDSLDSFDSSVELPASVEALEPVDESLLLPHPATAVARTAQSARMISENPTQARPEKAPRS